MAKKTKNAPQNQNPEGLPTAAASPTLAKELVAADVKNLGGNRGLTLEQAVTRINELDAYTRSLQSDRSKLQSTLNFFLAEILKISNEIEFPKKVTLGWLLLNVRNIVKVVEMVIAMIKAAKEIKKA